MMTTVHRVAYVAAKKLTKMVAPALLPAERREYFKKAYEVCRGLLETRGRLRWQIVPSVN
jgi:hypothetical protein